MKPLRDNDFAIAVMCVLCFLLAAALLDDADQRAMERQEKAKAERVQRVREAMWTDLDASGRRLTGYDHIKPK